VDRVDLDAGITGWAMDASEPRRALQLELVAGETVLTSAVTDVLRLDLAHMQPAGVTEELWAGFEFPITAVGLGAGLSPELRGQPLRVREKETGRFIGGPVLPSIAAIVDAVSDEGREGATAAPKVFARSARQLERALEVQRGRAGGLAGAPLVLDARAQRGFLEVICPIEEGVVLVGGWSQERLPRLSPVVVLTEGRKVPAGLFAAAYRRDDLPPGARAFCGVLRLEAEVWREDQDIVLSLGERERHLRSRRPMSLLDAGEARGWIQAISATLAPADLDLLRDVLGSAGGDQTLAVTPEAVGARAFVERLITFPGFGALVSGWVVAPQAELTGVRVQQGGKSARGGAEGLRTLRRPDLAEAFPQHADRIERAGFTALCIGPLPLRPGEPPSVVLELSDGQLLSLTAEPQRLRSGYEAPFLLELVQACPGFWLEPAFPKLVEAHAALVRGRPPRIDVVRGELARDLLVVAPPLRPTDLLLAAYDLGRALERMPESAGAVLLFGPRHDRTALMRALASRLPETPVAVFRHDAEEAGLAALAALLETGGADRFTYVAPGFRLAEAGVAAASAFHDAAAEELVVYRTPAEPAGLGRGRPASGAFSWTTAAFLDAFAKATPPLLPGDLGWALDGLDGLSVEGAVSTYHEVGVSPALRELAAAAARHAGGRRL
jgi:hypothetical protein